MTVFFTKSSRITPSCCYNPLDIFKRKFIFTNMRCRNKYVALLIFVTMLIAGMTMLHNGVQHTNVHPLILTFRDSNSNKTIPTIYIITPTYKRLTQKADLTRLAQTLRLVQHIHWVVIEDSINKTKLVTEFLQQCHVYNTHLCVKTVNYSEYREVYQRGGSMPKGVQQRNAGLDWIEKNSNGPHVVYFADDDNTYDVRIFEEMRNTMRVSVWPVGIVGGSLYETPAVKDGKVIGWIAGFDPGRKFALDMAAFAVNGDLLKERRARFNMSCVTHLEPCFLAQLKIGKDDLEPKADNCTKILVWHTKTSNRNPGLDPTRRKMAMKFDAAELEV